MNLFGKSKTKAPPPSASNQIMQVRQHLKTLEKKEDFLQKKIDDQLKLAKDMSKKKDKRGAMMALKKKKMYMGQRDALSNARFTLESQIATLENATLTKETVQTMQSTNQAIRQIHNEVSADVADDVISEAQEHMDEAREIQDALGTSLVDIDEDELEDEFADLENELFSDEDEELKLPDVPQTKKEEFPTVPTSVNKVEQEEEEDEFAALQAEMTLT